MLETFTDRSFKLHPKISIIIACYNYIKFVGLAIESALAQTYDNIEIIVVDDGSTDGSDTIIKSFGSRVKVLLQENGGQISACNKGFLAATGEIIIFLDADDLLMPEAAKEVASTWDKRYVKIQYDLNIIDGDGKFSKRAISNFTKEYSSQKIRSSFERHGTYRWPVTSGNAYSKSFLDKVMPATLSRNDYIDGFLNTISPVYGDIVTICKPLGCYRIHGDNVWASSGNDVARIAARIDRRYAEIRTLQEYAKRQNIRLPNCNPLDFELSFVNCRLMALKLGQKYEGVDADSPCQLWLSGLQLLLVEDLFFSVKLTHLIWLSTLALAPKKCAEALVFLRFNRANYLASIRSAVSGVKAR